MLPDHEPDIDENGVALREIPARMAFYKVKRGWKMTSTHVPDLPEGLQFKSFQKGEIVGFTQPPEKNCST